MKNFLLKLFPAVSFVALAPLVAYAQADTGPCSGVPGLYGVLCTIHSLLNYVVPVLIALGIVYFVYGVITYVIADGEEAKKTGRDRIIFGIIGLAVIISVWGLVYIITSTFRTDNYASPSSGELNNLLPQFPQQ